MLWGIVYPLLSEAVRLYDMIDSLPDSWFFGSDKSSQQRQVARKIDELIAELINSEALDARKQAKKLGDEIRKAREQVAEYRSYRIGAPSADSLSFFGRRRNTSREAYDESISAEEQKINDRSQQLEQCKEQFYAHLPQINIQASEDEIGYLLNPITNVDHVTMASAVANMISMTAELERLVDETKELPSHATKYYGMYLLLVMCIDRIQTQFVEEIDQVQVPKLQGFEQEARNNIAQAQNLLKSDHSRKVLAGNIDANMSTIEACRHLAAVLNDQKESIIEENVQIKKTLAVAANTYKTIRLSNNVAEVIGNCKNALKSLRGLRIPPLRPFQNLRLKQELMSLTERMIATR